MMASEQKWSPGPWRVDGERDPSRGQRIAATIDGATFTICYAETPQQGGIPRHDMREANARLIAAAPALFEALVAAKQEMWMAARDQWTMADFKNWAVIQQIDAALARARGDA